MRVISYVDKKCETCGKLMKQVSTRKHICEECKKRGMMIHYTRREKKKGVLISWRVDISQCKTCKYRSFLGSGKTLICNYIELEGHMRGCEPSPNCEKYEEGNSISIDLRGKWI